ncbi:hypothetical protein GFM44_23185 [Rhizobium leguminosarum bv. viciae]|nr:hypothetical protein [Rhizobium leguminosarum bv. viciae]
MTQSFPREQIAVQVADYRSIVSRASDLQCSLYGMVSTSPDANIKMLVLQAAEAIDLVRDLAKDRVRALLDAPTPVSNDQQEEAA